MHISDAIKHECWILESGVGKAKRTELKMLLLPYNEEGSRGDEQEGSEPGPFLTTHELRPRLLRNGAEVT